MLITQQRSGTFATIDAINSSDTHRAAWFGGGGSRPEAATLGPAGSGLVAVCHSCDLGCWLGLRGRWPHARVIVQRRVNAIARLCSLRIAERDGFHRPIDDASAEPVQLTADQVARWIGESIQQEEAVLKACPDATLVDFNGDAGQTAEATGATATREFQATPRTVATQCANAEELHILPPRWHWMLQDATPPAAAGTPLKEIYGS